MVGANIGDQRVAFSDVMKLLHPRRRGVPGARPARSNGRTGRTVVVEEVSVNTSKVATLLMRTLVSGFSRLRAARRYQGRRAQERTYPEPRQVCREPGARAATNVVLRDLNLGMPLSDGRRLEVIAIGGTVSAACRWPLVATVLALTPSPASLCGRQQAASAGAPTRCFNAVRRLIAGQLRAVAARALGQHWREAN